ncbi:MAG: integrase core domain-containing protein [Gammaproteobacteria bacterium]|nr:integrase core domain-containing protein [Gammaproteobacteria bacterium]
MDQFTRRIVGFDIHAGDVDGITLCRMFNNIIAGMAPPRYISSDNDPLFEFHRWQANLRIVGTDEIKTVPYTPVSHPFVERLIGTIRRAFLDHVLFWSTVDLEKKLREFQFYYNQERVHASLGGNTLAEVAGEPTASSARIVDFCWQTYCRGLVQLPLAA